MIFTKSKNNGKGKKVLLSDDGMKVTRVKDLALQAHQIWTRKRFSYPNVVKVYYQDLDCGGVLYEVVSRFKDQSNVTFQILIKSCGENTFRFMGPGFDRKVLIHDDDRMCIRSQDKTPQNDYVAIESVNIDHLNLIGHCWADVHGFRNGDFDQVFPSSNGHQIYKPEMIKISA